MGDHTKAEAGPGIGGTTRRRLLQAATALFAERGFLAVRVRDITDAAGCSVAAVNYHFGSKDTLYRRVLQEQLRALRDDGIEAIESALQAAAGRPTLERLLRGFAVTPGGTPGRSRCADLLWRELLDPRLAPRDLLDVVIKPIETAFVRAICGLEPTLGKERALHCARSVMAQLAYIPHLNRFLGSEDGCGQNTHLASSEVDHIVSFSAAGIRSLRNTRSVHESSSPRAVRRMP